MAYNECPSCGAPDAYIGIIDAECGNTTCELYTENQAYIIKQQKLAEQKIKEEQKEQEVAEDNKNKKAKTLVDKFITVANRSTVNKTNTVPRPASSFAYSGYSDKSTKDTVDPKRDTIPAPPPAIDDEEEEDLTPWNYNLFEEEEEECDPNG